MNPALIAVSALEEADMYLLDYSAISCGVRGHNTLLISREVSRKCYHGQIRLELPARAGMS